MQVGRTLLMLGLLLAGVGVLWMVAAKLGWGRLPGDIVVRKKNVTFYFPLVSSLVLSLLLTLAFKLFRK
jgi:hypothetical protein